MRSEDALREDGRAFGVNNIRWLEGPELGETYRVPDDLPKELTPTGLFEIFRVVSDDPVRRSFFGRWDNAVDRTGGPDSGHRMKVYLIRRDAEPKDDFAAEGIAFKQGHDGYAGHYPGIGDTKDGWTYHFDIRDRGGVLVLRGTLALGMARKVNVGLVASARVEAKAQHFRAGEELD
jgi:hypothetical protein